MGMVDLEGTRVLPWADWSEWLELKEMLSNGETEKACERVAMYRLRRRTAVPITILTSVALLKQLENPDPDPYLQRLALSMTLTRFVNGTTDRLQPRADGSSARSVNSLAIELQLPLMLVEIRHQASHNALPRLSTLTSAAKQALGWLEEFYWEPQLKSVQRILGNSIEGLRRLFDTESTFDPLLHGAVPIPVAKSRESVEEPVPDAAATVARMKQKAVELALETSLTLQEDDQQAVHGWSLCGNVEAWKVMPLGLIPGQLEVQRSRKRQRGDVMAGATGSICDPDEETLHAGGEVGSTIGPFSAEQGPGKKVGLSVSEEAYVAKKAAQFELLAVSLCDTTKETGG